MDKRWTPRGVVLLAVGLMGGILIGPPIANAVSSLVTIQGADGSTLPLGSHGWL